jgi:hypothetical protein
MPANAIQHIMTQHMVAISRQAARGPIVIEHLQSHRQLQYGNAALA